MLHSSLLTGVHHILQQEMSPFFSIFCIALDLYTPIVKYPVIETEYNNELGRELQHIRQFVKSMLIKEESHVRRQSCEQPAKK